jgi:glycosyltransferase involved in cell wall biosynthesis
VPRTVLYVAWAPFFSGAERALLLTVQSLDPARYEPYVVLGTEGPAADAFRNAGVKSEVLTLKPLDRQHPFKWAASAWRVREVARRLNPAIIHTNDAPSFQPAGHVGRWLGVPVLTHIRFPDTDDAFRWFLRPDFRRALFVSEALRTEALGTSGSVFEGCADVLHDGVVVPPAMDDVERTHVRGELGLPAGAPVVALTGQVSEVKGIWDFVDAATALGQVGVDAHFAVLGDDLKGGGALRRAMEARVSERGLSGRFHFLGFRPDAPRLIPAFDVIAVPSHIEPLGNATLEAMAAGRPVVGSRVGGIPEMVEDGVTGLLVPPHAPDALSSALRSLLEAPARREALGRAAHQRVAERFSLARHAERLQRIYDDVLVGC